MVWRCNPASGVGDVVKINVIINTDITVRHLSPLGFSGITARLISELSLPCNTAAETGHNNKTPHSHVHVA